MYFFTAGEDEVKCWQVRRGVKAPQAAGAIHTDFERGFICAEVMHFDELKELGSESAVKAAGKYRQEGKNYTVRGRERKRGRFFFFFGFDRNQPTTTPPSFPLPQVEDGDIIFFKFNVTSSGKK